MPERRVTVSLAAPGSDAVRAAGVFDEFTRVQRLKRGVVVLLVAILLAATLIPIPIVHLLGIPLLLIGGGILAVRQVSMVGRLRPLRIACPKCHEPNRVGGGLGYANLEPRPRMCESCRRELTLSLDFDPP